MPQSVKEDLASRAGLWLCRCSTPDADPQTVLAKLNPIVDQTVDATKDQLAEDARQRARASSS